MCVIDGCSVRAMKTATKTAAAFLAAAMTLAPAANAFEGDVDWTGGRPLPPGTEVPFDPGYASAFKMYDVIRLGDPNYRNAQVPGVRVVGKFEGDQIMCLMNAKGGLTGCYVDGQPATNLGWGRGGMRVTTDPVIERFAPAIKEIQKFEAQFSSGSSLSSR